MNKFMHIEEMPPPPALPKYDPNEDAPRWTLSRLRYNLPVERTKPWTHIGTVPESPDDPDWRGVIRSNVIEYPVPDGYKFGKKLDPNYFWFDTPDYADPFKKLGFAVKWFLWSGAFAGVGIACLEHRKFNMENHMHIAKRYVIPWFLAGMIGSTAVVCLANLRGKKDDVYNYLAAGFLMGSFMGRQDHLRFTRCVCVLTPLAYAVKYNAETNGKLWPVWDPRVQNQSITGLDGEHGLLSGDFRFGIRTRNQDPGRDVRTPY